MPSDAEQRPRLLDLFCGAGGCSVGYHRAGFDVTGVDRTGFARYPFEQVVADVLTLDPEWVASFDAVHASPPCQAHSGMTTAAGTDAQSRHPDLLDPTRDLLNTAGRPWVIENVPGAPLRDPIRLCGSMFTGLRVRRHRLFESSELLMAPRCGTHQPVWSHQTSSHWHRYRNGEITDEDLWTMWLSPVGHPPQVAAHADAMGIDWMSSAELVQAIPPAYTEYIGRQLIRLV